MDILFLLKVMWRKKWLWIITPILASGAAFLFTLKSGSKIQGLYPTINRLYHERSGSFKGGVV
jgi:hypothetical protein